MIKLLGLLVLLPMLTHARTVSKSGLEAYMDSYFEKQLTQDIIQAVPDAKFSLHVRTGLNEQLLRASGENASLKLPLGGSFLLEHEADTTLKKETGLEHPESYRDALTSVQVELAWQGELQEDVKQWLKSHILMSLRVSGDVLHDIKISNLPTGFEKKPVEVIIPEKKLGWLEKRFSQLEGISAHESAALLLAAAAALFSFIGFALKIFVSSGQFWGFSRVFKDGIKKVSESLAQSTSASMPMSTMPVSAPEQVQAFASARESERSWDSVQIPELKAFAYDCLEHALYESAAIIVTHHFINPTRAQELKAELPSHFFDVDGPGRVLAPVNEIEQMFFQNRLQYVLLSERPLVQALLTYSVPQCLRMIEQFIGEKKSLEALSIVNRLTPIKRELVLEQLELSSRLKLATWADQKVGHEQLEASEAALTKSLARPVNKVIEAHSVQFPFKSIGNELFKARGFAEDEVIHNWHVEQGKTSGSVISAISVLGENVWSSMPLNEVALAFFGHSEEVHAELMVHFDQKRQDWLKNFIQKYSQANMRWDSPEVVAARAKIIKLLPLDRNGSMADNKEDEKPLQLLKAA